MLENPTGSKKPSSDETGGVCMRRAHGEEKNLMRMQTKMSLGLGAEERRIQKTDKGDTGEN